MYKLFVSDTSRFLQRNHKNTESVQKMRQKSCDLISDPYLESATHQSLTIGHWRKLTDHTTCTYLVGSIPPLSNSTVIKFLSQKKWTELPAIDIKKITPNRTFANLVREVRFIRSHGNTCSPYRNTQSREDGMLRPLVLQRCCRPRLNTTGIAPVIKDSAHRFARWARHRSAELLYSFLPAAHGDSQLKSRLPRYVMEHLNPNGYGNRAIK